MPLPTGGDRRPSPVSALAMTIAKCFRKCPPSDTPRSDRRLDSLLPTIEKSRSCAVATHRYHPLSSTQRQPLTQSCSSLLNSSYATTQSRSQPPSRLKQHTVPQVLCLLNSSYALNLLHSHPLHSTDPRYSAPIADMVTI